MNSLSDRDLALLHTKFVVPMAVGDILRGDEPLDETSEYVLNTVIGDLQPDTALLCIALCAQRIAAHCDHLPSAHMLGAEADRMADDYGSLWLAKDRSADGGMPRGLRKAHREAAMQALRFVPEDLEAMAHLLDATLAEMGQPRSPAARLCDLLAVQAHEHMDVADAQLESAQARAPAKPVVREIAAAGTNIVAFPMLRRS